MEEGLREEIRALLRSQSLGVLATSASGHPYTTLVAFAESADLAEIFFATHRSTRKYANLAADARVTLLVDNRSNRPEDFRGAVALTVFGTARELAAGERAAPETLFLAKHPFLKEFVASPGCALCRISPQRYGLVRRFQDVVELVLDATVPVP